jgi:hypothetical protein
MNSSLEIQAALKDWIPYRLYLEEGQRFCRWLFIDKKDFTEPFFDETILNCKQTYSNSQRIKCVSSLDILTEWSGNFESIQPSAFIFHVSRCGSTLATQLLGLNEANITLSEVPFFDELLRSKKGDQTALLLQAAISFYGAKRKPTQQRLFIKTDSWHIFFYPLIRKMYPGIPFILLYRQPGEVILSHQKRRGMHAVQDVIEPGLFGFDRENIMNLSLDEYTAKVLEKYFQSFIEIAEKDSLAFLVNYNEGPLAIVEKIATTVGFSLTEDELNKMKQRAGYHAKYPNQIFSEETVQSSTPGYLAPAVELYETLEKTRKSIISYA